MLMASALLDLRLWDVLDLLVSTFQTVPSFDERNPWKMISRLITILQLQPSKLGSDPMVFEGEEIRRSLPEEEEERERFQLIVSRE